MIYAFVYGDPGVFAEASEELARPHVHIQLEGDDVNTGARKDELVKFGSAHRITGLQDTGRQIRLETEDFNPLWKAIAGSSEALFRVFDQPNPFEYVRYITICMEQGDIVHERGEVNLSERFINLLVHFTCFRYLEAVRLNGCISSFDLEEKDIFNKIWDLLQMGAWVKLHFELIHCSPR
jgi:hypothetical protein